MEDGSNCRSCNGNGNGYDCGCDGCCPCAHEFEDVHCSLDDLCYKVCVIQDIQEEQGITLSHIKTTVNDNCDKLETLQEGVDELLGNGGDGAGGGNGGNGGEGGNGKGKGCLVCINCGNCCCDGENGEDGCCCCCDDDCDHDNGPGGGTDPEPLCLIKGGNDFENQDIIELWFSTKFKSCARDFYLTSSSFNWAGDDEDINCGQTGFHG